MFSLNVLFWSVQSYWSSIHDW